MLGSGFPTYLPPFAMKNDPTLSQYLLRIAQAVEQLTPGVPPDLDIKEGTAFVWQADLLQLKPANKVNCVDLILLKGINQARETLLENTCRFAKGFPANNALLWGARGMGKSSLVKAVHNEINQREPFSLVLVEIHREDIHSLPPLLDRLREQSKRFLLFCDDLSFDAGDSDYKSLKAVLEGGIEGRPNNVIFYATSNRRHMLPRDIIENDQSSAINPSDAVDEKISLSDRFGLWLGFHACDQPTYLAMIDAYAEHYRLNVDSHILKSEAIEWSVTRGARSGRVAWQYIQDLAGRLKRKLDD